MPIPSTIHAATRWATGSSSPNDASSSLVSSGERAPWPAELLVFRGDEAEVAETVRVVRSRVATDPTSLPDLALAVASRGRGAARVAAVVTSVEDLVELLPAVADGTPVRDRVLVADGTEAGQVAFVYSGQGSQRPHMAAGLFDALPGLRHHLRAGAHLVPTVYPPEGADADSRRAQREAVTATTVAQPALGMVALALTEVLERCGVTPDMAAGHSYGEVAALAAAGVLPPDRLVEISERRAEAMLESTGDDPGAMAAVAAPAAEVASALVSLGAPVVVANDNAPLQTVISGPTVAVADVAAHLRDDGLSVKMLPVACAFHSPLMSGADIRFETFLRSVPITSPRFEVWSNATAAPHPDAEDIAAVLGAQMTGPVRWTEQVDAMWRAGARTFVEIGPGRVLAGLVGKILADRPHTTIVCDVPGQPEVTRLLVALGQLAVLGVPVDPVPLLEGRARPLDLDRAAPRER